MPRHRENSLSVFAAFPNGDHERTHVLGKTGRDQ